VVKHTVAPRSIPSAGRARFVIYEMMIVVQRYRAAGRVVKPAAGPLGVGWRIEKEKSDPVRILASAYFGSLPSVKHAPAALPAPCPKKGTGEKISLA